MAIKTTEKLLFNKAFTDPVFAKDIFNELPLNSFSEETRELSQIVKRHYLTSSDPVSEKELGIYIEKRFDLDDPDELTKALSLKEIAEQSYTIMEDVKEEVATQTLNEHVREILSADAISKMLSDGTLDNKDDIKNLSDRLLEVARIDVDRGRNDNLFDVINETDRKIELYNSLRSTTYPTGLTNLDDLLEGGGLGRGEVALLIAPTGMGKALVNGTKVQTPEGPVNIEDLEEGSKVFGRDGKAHNVIGVFPQGKKRVYEVEFSDGTVIENNDEHIWTFQTASQRGDTYTTGQANWTTATLREIIDNYPLYLEQPGGGKKKNIYLPMPEPVEYEEKDLPVDPYLLGALLGDGGLSERKSYEKFVPNKYLQGSIKQRTELLRGLIDTDGYVANSGVTYSTSSPHLAEDVKELANSLGMVGNITTKEPQYRYKGELKKGKTSYNVYIKILRNGILPFSSEKHKNNFTQGQTQARRTITDIRETDRYEEMTCISVDAEDELFLTENFIPTHNTTVATQIARNNVANGLNVLYITLEEKLARMVMRLDMSLLQAGQNAFFNPETTMADEKLINYLPNYYSKFANIGNLHVLKYQPRKVTLDDIEQDIIDMKTRQGIPVDVVIIDYPALIKTRAVNDSNMESTVGGQLFEDIRALSQKHEFVCYTLAQTNRMANNQDIVTAAYIEGSKRVLNACELVVTMNRKDIEYQNKFFRLHIDKIRNRAQGAQIPPTLSYKIDPNGWTVRASTENEKEQHDELLDNMDMYKPTDVVAKGQTKADKINEQMGG